MKARVTLCGVTGGDCLKAKCQFFKDDECHFVEAPTRPRLTITGENYFERLDEYFGSYRDEY